MSHFARFPLRRFALRGREGISPVSLEKALPIAAILGAVLLWGGSFSAMRVAVSAMSPWSVMWVRMTAGLLLVLPFAVRLRPENYRPGDWKYLIPMVLFQPCLYFLLESYALRLTTSAQAGVISASVPLMVAIAAGLALGERISRATLIGLVISMAGVAALTLLSAPDGRAENPLLGNALELGAMICAAANFIAVKVLSRRYGPWTLTALQTGAGAIFFLPGLFFLLDGPPVIWSGRLIVSLVFLGAFVTLGAFGLFNWGMSRIPASRASAFINLVPVCAVLLGWLLLDEGLAPLQWLAAAAVIGGVGLSQRDRTQNENQKNPSPKPLPKEPGGFFPERP
jgi:drug/metabolite transporter (DMT)-like permease